MKNKAFSLSVVISFFICLFVSVLCFENTCDDIRQDVLRLHVIAHSDSEDSQRLKLQVRDEVLAQRGYLFENVTDITSAKKKISESLDEIRQTAQETVDAQGYSCKVSVSLEKSFFTTRVYSDSTVLPAGYYDALKIVIGQGEGKNWWCVMFPPMCLSAAEEQSRVLSDVLDDKEMKIVSANPKYEVRFWIVEKYWQAVEKLKGRK